MLSQTHPIFFRPTRRNYGKPVLNSIFRYYQNVDPAILLKESFVGAA
jgi:hypothetical protein